MTHKFDNARTHHVSVVMKHSMHMHTDSACACPNDFSYYFQGVRTMPQQARQQLALTDTCPKDERNASALSPKHSINLCTSFTLLRCISEYRHNLRLVQEEHAARHISMQSVGMCTLPEMSSTECFVLVGVVQDCSRSFALLV